MMNEPTSLIDRTDSGLVQLSVPVQQTNWKETEAVDQKAHFSPHFVLIAKRLPDVRCY